MRTRSSTMSKLTTDLSVNISGTGDTEFYSFPRIRAYYEDNAGPATLDKSVITDDLNAPRSALVPHDCIHKRNSAAVFDSRIKLIYPTPTPDADIAVKGCFMFDRVSDVPAFPAAALMDDLASLLSGNVNTRLSLPIFLLEGAKTLAMLRNPFNLLKPDFRKRVRKLTAASLLAKGASIWLEQLFGWQQFKSDVDESAKVLATFMNSSAVKRFEDEDSRVSASSTTKSPETSIEYTVGASAAMWTQYHDKFNWDNGVGGFFRLQNCFRETTHRLGCRQRSNMLNTFNQTRKFLQLTGSRMNFYNIRDVIWEMIPFSFVLDWFVDTSSIWYLPNYVRLSEMDVKWLCHSTKSILTYDVDWLPSPRILYYQNAFPWGYRTPIGKSLDYVRTVGKGKQSYYYRTLGFPIPDLDADTVFKNSGLTWSKLTTGAALFAQRIFQNR